MLPLRDYLPSRATPVVNYVLIAVNLAVFALEASGAVDPDAASDRWVLVPGALVAHPLACAPSLLTHMFLHASLVHVGGNMLGTRCSSCGSSGDSSCSFPRGS